MPINITDSKAPKQNKKESGSVWSNLVLLLLRKLGSSDHKQLVAGTRDQNPHNMGYFSLPQWFKALHNSQINHSEASAPIPVCFCHFLFPFLFKTGQWSSRFTNPWTFSLEDSQIFALKVPSQHLGLGSNETPSQGPWAFPNHLR